MNRQQRRAAKKRNKAIHKEALRRTKAHARRTAKTHARGEADALALDMAFDPAMWHPESPWGMTLAKLMTSVEQN